MSIRNLVSSVLAVLLVIMIMSGCGGSKANNSASSSPTIVDGIYSINEYALQYEQYPGSFAYINGPYNHQRPFPMPHV